MSYAFRNRLLGRGALWGLCLAVVPAFVMANPLRPDGVLKAAARTRNGGYAPGGTVDPSSLMLSQVFLGSLFVPLSVFLYTLAGGFLLGPVFGTLMNRAARVGAKGELR